MPTPPPVIKRYYPTLSSVVSMDDFPESLGFLKKAIESLFSKIHYKDLQYKKSPKGDAAFYSLSIVSQKLAIELFGSGISLVLNPDESNTADFNISAFPVTVEYQWKILAYLRSFDLNNFSFTPQEFFELGLIILNVSEEQAMAQFINTFTIPVNDTTLPLQQFINDLKLYNNDPVIQSLNLTVTNDTKLKDVAQSISAHTGKYATLYSFGAYLLKNDLNETKEKLGEFFKKFIPEDIESYINDILVPKARATLTVSAAIEFPRNILYPYIQNGAIWEREPETSSIKTRFYFGKILLYADTQEGVGYKMDLVGDLRPTYSEIGKTGLLLQLEKLKLDLSDKVNIPEADADGRPVDFKGVYADALSVTLPAKWFKMGTNTNGSTLRIGGYNLLIGTGGVSGTFALEAVPTQNVSDGQITNFFSDKFAFVYPIKGLKNNAVTNNEEEIEITSEAGLLTYLNSLTNKSLYNFKFPLEVIPTGSIIRKFRNSFEFKNFITDFIIAENGTMWFNIGSQEKGFLIGFNKFDITFKQNKITSSNIRGALEIKKFVHPETGQQVRIEVEGHLEDNGNFNLGFGFVPSYPIKLPDVFTYNLKTVELGKEENDDDDLFYIGTSGTIQFEGLLKETMGLGPIEIERLRIYSDGSIELKGGSVNLIQPMVLKLGPVEITVTAIHYGSHQKEVDGIMRKFNYFGFDGGISVDPLGIEIRGDGVKFYYCSDDLPNKPKSYLHIKTIYLDLTLPASTPVAIVNGWLSIPEPGVSKEYAGGLKLQLPKVKITGSVDMKLMPKYPAFIIDASLDFPGPIPLGPLGIYGFRGLFGYRYVAEKEAIGMVSGVDSWYDYYKAPQRGINVRKFNGPDKTKLSGTPISIGAGASLGTSADNGTVLNIKAMVLLSIPSLFMIDGRAAVLSARLGLEDTAEPPFFAFIAVGDDSLELGFGADFKMPTNSGSILSIYADVQAGFFFKNQKPWYVNIGKDTNPVTARILTLITLKSYVMLSAKGIAAGARGEFDFQRNYGIIRVHAWAYIEVGGKISFERPQFSAYLKAGVGADIDIKFISLYLAVDIMFGVEASKPFKIFGSFYYKVRIKIAWIFKFTFSGQLDVVWEFNNEVDRSPINPMINTANLSTDQIKKKLENLVTGVNMLSNEKFDLAYLGDYIPVGISGLTDSKILDKIIPVDTYIDIKTEKGLLPGENTSTNSVRKLLGGINNPPEQYTDLIPPESSVQGKPMRQVKHKYSLEKIEIMFWNGFVWKEYNPYKAMYPNDPLVDNLKIGQFQKTDGQYNMVRLLATSPFSYTEQGQPGWYVPEQYGITAGTLFCKGQEIDKKCANFEFNPLNHKYYCSNPNHLLFSNGAAFQLLDLFQTSYAEVTDETYFNDLTKSLKFDNLNQMQIVFPNSALQVGLKVTNFANGVRVKFYSTIVSPQNDLLPNPVYGNPDPNATKPSEPFIIEKNVADLNVAIQYNEPSWRGVSKVVIEPIFDAAVILQINHLTEQIASITENNNLISLGYISGEIIDTTLLENQLEQLACGGGSPDLDINTTFVNRYKRADMETHYYSEEFFENNTAQIFSIGETNNKGLITKLNSNGDVVWEKNYTITDNAEVLIFRKIVQLKQEQPSNDYLYVIYASTRINHYLIGIRESGEPVWIKQLNEDSYSTNVEIIASLLDSSFYISISDLVPVKNPPQVVHFNASGNFINGRLLHLDQKYFSISALAIDLNGIVLGGNLADTKEGYGVIISLKRNLEILSSLLLEPYTVIHDVKILEFNTYLVSGNYSKDATLFVTKIIENKEQSSIILLPDTIGKLSQLQLNSDGFYLLVTDSKNGILHQLNQHFVIQWTKEIKFINEANGFKNFRFNLQSDQLTFNLYSRTFKGSLVAHTNKDIQSCFTKVLDIPILKQGTLTTKNLNLNPDKFEILLKIPKTESVLLESYKLELCPVVIDLCGTDMVICPIYNDILSIFNECFKDPNLLQNANVNVNPFVNCAQSIVDMLTVFSNENQNFNLLIVLANQILMIERFIAKVAGQDPNHSINECSCYLDAWNATNAIINYLDKLGHCNCSCRPKNYTLLHEVCWMSVEDYEYNANIPSQAAIAADATATIKGINDFIQPTWRPDTSYYIHIELKDTVENSGSTPYKFTYGFTTGGPVGYFHTHPKATYGDITLKAGQYLNTNTGSIAITTELNGKILEDTEGTIKNQDGTLYTGTLPDNAVVSPHPDKYPLTSLGQYIDYERSYPNANGNLLGAKPLFYKDNTTQIYLFFNKSYAKNFFREWPTYQGKQAQKGMLKIVIKDPIESANADIVNPPSLNYDSSITTIPQTIEEWKEDENPQIPFVLSQYGAMFSAPNCIGAATVIKPKSEYITIIPKDLKPNKLYTAIVNNMYTTNSAFAVSPELLLDQTREVHRFVFKTSRYETFKQQVESFMIKQTIDGLLVQKKAIFQIESKFSLDQVDGIYNTITGVLVTGFNAVILANLENNYQHPFDRIFEGILGMKPLDEAISTEINVIRNLENNKVIAIIVRNPEPFNNPKMPVLDLGDSINLRDTITVLSGITVNDDYKVLHSKDYSQAIIMHSSKEITSNLTLQFKYKIWDGSKYIVPAEDLNPSTPNLYTVTLEVEI